MTTSLIHHRRRFLLNAASAAAAVQLGVVGCSTEQPHTEPPVGKIGANRTFDSIKQVDAGLLNIGYAEAGPTDGPPVILLHGWPYDIYSYVDVVPLLTTKGYRIIVPYLRGFGT